MSSPQQLTAGFHVLVNPMASNPVCGACKFVAMLPGSGQTVCKRFPPAAAAYAVPPGAGASVWPPVGLDDWCGEFQPAPVAAKKP